MDDHLLKGVTVHQFKGFESLSLQFGLLTLLSGRNSSGKSTILQSILLYSQALRKNERYNGVLYWPLNGELTRLGSFGDVLNSNSKDSEIQFEYEFENSNEPKTFRFTAESLERNLKPVETSKHFDETESKLISQVQFLSSTRIITNDNSIQPDSLDYYFEGVGIDGRYACFWYNKFKDSVIASERHKVGSKSSSFSKQVNAWLDYISPGTNANVVSYENLTALTLQFRLSDTGEWRSPTNVGCGISYVFPIIVALLGAKSGDCIIIDKPEAHLHPQAQSRIGKMIAKFASTGIQIIIETHSDHILNGIRIAVKNGELNPNDLRLWFFSGCTPENHGVYGTQVDKNGQIEHWPDGFFDQSDKDVVELLEIQ